MDLHPHRRDAERAEETQRVVERFRASRNSAQSLRLRRLGNLLLSVERALDLVDISCKESLRSAFVRVGITVFVRF